MRDQLTAWGLPEVTLSIGVLSCRIPCADAERCVHGADCLMYRAKRSGRDAVACGVLDHHGAATPTGTPLPDLAVAAHGG